MIEWRRFVGASFALLFLFGGTSHALAGCTCGCSEGEVRASCTNSYEVPPICALKTCPFVPRAGGPALGTSSRCRLVRNCDVHGFCSEHYQC